MHSLSFIGEKKKKKENCFFLLSLRFVLSLHSAFCTQSAVYILKGPYYYYYHLFIYFYHYSFYQISWVREPDLRLCKST